MRKLLLVALLIIVFYMNPVAVLAVPYNSYECVPVGPVPACVPNTNTDTCIANYAIPNDPCSAYDGDPDRCNLAGGACEPVPPGTQEPPLDFGQLYNELRQGNADFTFSESLTVGDIISSLIPYIFVIAGLLLLVYLLYGGLTLMLSRGDPKAVAAARERITFALVGFVIVFVSYWIVQIVGQILGIQAIQDIFS